MHRVVVTGIGIVSCIGNDRHQVLESLKIGRSGIRFRQEYANHGMRCHVAGVVDIDLDELIDRKYRRFMGDAAGYAYLAMQQAIQDAQLDLAQISSPRIGLIAGSGGASSHNQVEACDILRSKGLRRIGPYRVTRTMGSTVSACLATSFGIQGINYSISSACATSAHCIGAAMEQIQLGKQDIVFAGGGEEEGWEMSCLFDAMGAFSTNFNDNPTHASRPYDANRDGFVIAGGGGILVLEEYEHALKRGAPIYAELVGYGANSDGVDMVVPSGAGSLRCMQMALAQTLGPIDYINTHGTSTPAGDIVELNALRKVFADKVPPLSSTKSLTGHSLGATGVQEAIYCLLMMQNDFICASANIETLDPQAEGLDIVRTRRDQVKLNRVLTNSFGFGGTNASLIFERI